MNRVRPNPLKFGALGMDDRTVNLFRLFFRGPCRGAAELTQDEAVVDADAFLIDLDSSIGQVRFDEKRLTRPDCPIVTLSLNPKQTESGVIALQKPVRLQDMLTALDQVRSRLSPVEAPIQADPNDDDTENAVKIVVARELPDGSREKLTGLLDEQSFASYLGFQPDVSPTNPTQVGKLYYEPREYLLAYVTHACQLANNLLCPIRIETPWKAVIALPAQRKIWIDADETQLRSACGLQLRKIVNVDVENFREAAPVVTQLSEPEIAGLIDHPRALPMEATIWKMALWTSKGRVPRGLDLDKPIKLKRWPNLTRVMAPPHSMRIAALLWREPCSLFMAAQRLKIRQQFVFAFAAAAYAQDLIELDPIIAPPENSQETRAPAPEEKISILRKILLRLKLN